MTDKDDGYKRFMLFKTTIAHELLINGSLELTFDGELGDDFIDRARKYKIFIRKEFIEKQAIPAESSTFSKMTLTPGKDGLDLSFSYFVSRLEIRLEIFEEEIGIIKSYKPSETSIIFQKLLLSFSRYYNEAMRGNDFFKPIISGYGPQIYSLRENNNNRCAHIAGSFSLIRNHKEAISSELINKNFSHIPWRYYYYKAIDCYDIGEYLDTVIWSSVSIETYIMDKIRNAGLVGVINNTNSSFFSEVEYLRKAKIMKKEDAKCANKTFSRIKDYRNEIIHGDIDSTFYSEKRAGECLRVLKEFYRGQCF